MDDRERQYLELTKEFPESPMGHFSLGKLYLDQGRYDDAAKCLDTAVRLDPTYAAAMVSLGEAYAGAGKTALARTTWEKAIEHARAQKHNGLAAEIEDRIAELDS
jgi:cytochrome c-type biogenesis protein CcmH/NrfG